jgi:hypothetical protein
VLANHRSKGFHDRALAYTAPITQFGASSIATTPYQRAAQNELYLKSILLMALSIRGRASLTCRCGKVMRGWSAVGGGLLACGPVSVPARLWPIWRAS